MCIQSTLIFNVKCWLARVHFTGYFVHIQEDRLFSLLTSPLSIRTTRNVGRRICRVGKKDGSPFHQNWLSLPITLVGGEGIDISVLGCSLVIPSEIINRSGLRTPLPQRGRVHSILHPHQCPHSLRETNFKENNAISHLTDDNIILNPLLPSDTLDQ